jgi:hypothetical protein
LALISGERQLITNFWRVRDQLRRLLPHVIAWAGVWMLLAYMQGYDFDWDILNYHYYNGYAFLYGMTFTNLQPADLQTYLHPLADSVFYTLVKHLPPTAVILAIAFFQSLSFPILFCICRRLFADRLPGNRAFWISLVVTILGAMAPVSIAEAGSHRGDTDMAPIILAALLLVIDVLQRPGSSSTAKIAIAGALTGFVAGLKLTNAAFAIGLGAAAVAQAFVTSSRGRSTGIIRVLAAYWIASAASFLVFYGWWGALLYFHFGNPFFPYFNQIFHSPFAASTSYEDPAFDLPSWRDKLLFPFVRNSLVGPLNSAGLFDLRMACALPAILLALTASLFRRFRQAPPYFAVPAAEIAILLFVFVSYVCWLLAFPINRYLAAVDLVAPLATILAVSLVWQNRYSIAIGTLVLTIYLPLSAYRTVPLWWLPDSHRHGDDGGYFGVSFTPPPNLDRAVVAMLSDQPVTFVIPFFPRTTTFVRLRSWMMLFPLIAFNDLNKPAGRAGVFGSAMGRAICQRLDQAGDKLFLLHLRPADTPRDATAMTYFGLADSGGNCTRIPNKSDMELVLCPAKRTARPECNNKTA